MRIFELNLKDVTKRNVAMKKNTHYILKTLNTVE